jgi:hypothetical protein
MFLSDDRRKGTESSLNDEYILAMVLKNCWPTQSVEEAKKENNNGFYAPKGAIWIDDHCAPFFLTKR